MTRSVLFVCTANICRSPMAMGLMQAIVASSEDAWRVESAGVWAAPGRPAAKNTQAVLKSRGIDISAHRSRQVTSEMMGEFNLVLVMERNHKEALRAAFPEYASQVFLLSEMVGRSEDIVDPIGREMADFQVTAREIELILTRAFGRIAQLAASTKG